METMAGGLALSVILLLAFYGLASLVERVREWLLRPRSDRTMLVLYLDDTVTDAESQLRAAQYTAVSKRLPLYVLDHTTNNDLRRIVSVLLRNGVGETVTEIPPKKMVPMSCDEKEDCV